MGCNGICEKGPVAKIEPDGITYFKVKVEDVEDIIKNTIINDEVIDKLLYKGGIWYGSLDREQFATELDEMLDSYENLIKEYCKILKHKPMIL